MKLGNLNKFKNQLVFVEFCYQESIGCGYKEDSDIIDEVGILDEVEWSKITLKTKEGFRIIPLDNIRFIGLYKDNPKIESITEGRMIVNRPIPPERFL
jgi:hypothetical protein